GVQPEAGGQAEGAGHDRGRALGAADFRGEAADDLRIHQGGIGRRDVLGDDDATLRKAREGLVGCAREIADEAGAALADAGRAGGGGGVVELGEARRHLADLGAHGGLGVDALLGDPALDAAHDARAAEHLQAGVEQEAEFLGGGTVEVFRLVLELLELALRLGQGIGEPLLLGRYRILGDGVFGDVDVTGLDNMRRPDRDAGRDAEAVEAALGPRAAAPGGAVALALKSHRTSARRARRARRAPRRHRGPWRVPRSRYRGRRPASS